MRAAVVALPVTPDEPLLPVAAPPATGDGDRIEATPAHPSSFGQVAAATDEAGDGLTFDDPVMDWSREEDPFASLGPVDPESTDDSVGLARSIRARMREIGGRVEVDSRPGSGAEVRLWGR